MQTSCRLRTDDPACPLQAIMRANQFFYLQWPSAEVKATISTAKKYCNLTVKDYKNAT